MKKILTLLIVLTASFSIIASPKTVYAQECQPIEWLQQSTGIPEGRIIPCSCTEGGPEGCGLNQVLQTIVNVSKLILAVTGAAAILMFSYGGVMFIIAAGNQEKIQQGKDALKAATIGIVIVLTAWLIVNFTISAITQGEVTGGGIFDRPWTEGPSAQPEELDQDTVDQINSLPNF